MKTIHIAAIAAASILTAMISCNNNNDKGTNGTAEFAAPEVVNINPAGQVRLSSLSDSANVAGHMSQNPERWAAALDYLANTNFDTLALGEYEVLPGREVYAIVSEYTPKVAEDCMFEAHKKYIDLQYIIRGREVMGVTHADSLQATAAYSDEKDIEFFAFDGVDATYQTAEPSKYYVFLPADVHRPSMRCENDSTTHVKKIVLKIKY